LCHWPLSLKAVVVVANWCSKIYFVPKFSFFAAVSHLCEVSRSCLVCFWCLDVLNDDECAIFEDVLLLLWLLLWLYFILVPDLVGFYMRKCCELTQNKEIFEWKFASHTLEFKH
jgi:hypothetical protein